MSREPYLPGRRRTTVTVGTFDGVHRGHQEVLREIVRRARAADRASVLVTFEPHPLEIVAPERAPRLLTTPGEKLLLWPLFELDYVHVLPFTPALREMSPPRFVREVLVDRLRVGELVIGYDHGFGKDRKGDVETLRRLAAELDFQVDVVGPVAVGEEAVSSTAVRRAVESGDLEAAARGLGRPYSALGRVVRGVGRGRQLGFATANLATERRKCLPPVGVYAVRAGIDGRDWRGMANLGPRPTFGDEAAGLEVHLLDWPGEELYDAWLDVEFVARLRGVRRFAGPAELAAQLAADRERARAVLDRRPIQAPGVA
ncbi:MAG TPA: bifunctional riboflavin kinase/FAD synthetase [Gemmatimonadota bacterium]|nr:bifunctional riboflavin kinase/FAD synthetase [Gemmatimonadota bacterium]